jgi:hypothetical protein
VNFPPLSISHTSETQTLLIFHHPVAKRAFGGGLCPPSAACGGCSQTAAQFAPNARNVENFHCLLSHGIVRNLEVTNFHLCE